MPKRRVTHVALIILALAALSFGYLAFNTWRGGRALESRIQRATSDLESGNWEAASSSLQSLSGAAEGLAADLRGPLGSIASVVPYAGRSVRTARALAESAAMAADAATSVLPVLQTESFWQSGRVNLDALRNLRRVAQEQSPRVVDALELARRSPGGLLPPPLSRARTEAIERLSSAAQSLAVAVRAVDLSDRVLGAVGERRYFIAFENPVENRGAGGLWGNYGVVIAEDARLRLGRFGRTQQELAAFTTQRGPDWYEARYAGRFGASGDWRQFSTAPDFPVVASIAERDLRKAEGIGPVAGTIAIDPIGLAAMLRITGPVQVPSWPEPITADNVARITMHDAYGRFDANDDRIEFMGETAEVVWSRLVSGNFGLSAIARSGLGSAIEGKHLRMHFVRDDEQSIAERLGADGGLGNPSNTFGLVTQNMSGNKMDYWLKRKLEVRLNLQSDGGAVGTATITLTNDGPSSGEPRYVIGPFNDLNKPGQNTQYVRMYLPGSAAIRPSRSSENVQIANEQGFVVAEWDVPLLAGETAKRRISFVIEDVWADSKLDLTIRRQQGVNPDQIRVDVKPPWGRRVALEADPACDAGTTDKDLPFRAAVRSWILGWIVGPWARDAACGK